MHGKDFCVEVLCTPEVIDDVLGISMRIESTDLGDHLR